MMVLLVPPIIWGCLFQISTMRCFYRRRNLILRFYALFLLISHLGQEQKKIFFIYLLLFQLFGQWTDFFMWCQTVFLFCYQVYFELQHHAPHVKKIIDDQHSRLRKAQQKILDVERKQEKIADRVEHAVQFHSELKERLQSLGHLPAAHKRSLSKAEREFKSELGNMLIKC